MNYARRDPQTGAWPPLHFGAPRTRRINYRELVEQRIRLEYEPTRLDPPARDVTGWGAIAARAAAWLSLLVRLARAAIGA